MHTSYMLGFTGPSQKSHHPMQFPEKKKLRFGRGRPKSPVPSPHFGVLLAACLLHLLRSWRCALGGKKVLLHVSRSVRCIRSLRAQRKKKRSARPTLQHKDQTQTHGLLLSRCLSSSRPLAPPPKKSQKKRGGGAFGAWQQKSQEFARCPRIPQETKRALCGVRTSVQSFASVLAKALFFPFPQKPQTWPHGGFCGSTLGWIGARKAWKGKR
jgi:hypothetical protein